MVRQFCTGINLASGQLAESGFDKLEIQKKGGRMQVFNELKSNILIHKKSILFGECRMSWFQVLKDEDTPEPRREEIPEFKEKVLPTVRWNKSRRRFSTLQ